jgi:single-stranded-DNA-specific exonuclease
LTGPRLDTWVPAAVPEATRELEASGVSALLAPLLARRGVATPADAARFLDPKPEHLHDPDLLAGMPAAIDRLVAARERGETVVIVGDYDADGVTAVALLLGVLRFLGIKAEPVLPRRLQEGYGFQPQHVERAAEAGAALIVTVDCGTSAGAAVAAALAAGVDVIVTDHHLPGDPLPAAALLVNPRQPGCPYPFPDLAGVGLALKLAQSLGRRLGREAPLDALLRVACLGTIADLVPLRGENRVIAALGLRALESARSPGIRALIQGAALRSPYDASDVAFRLGPRLNAAGRLGSADAALDLLLARDAGQATRLAAQLESANRQRQEEERRVVDEARAVLSQRVPRPAILIAWSPGWHPGVVGIAAGRLAREFLRPTVLLAERGDEATGSGRSIDTIDLHGFLALHQALFLRFGGHRQAVGLTVRSETLPILRERLEEAAGAWPPESFIRRHEYELVVQPGEVAAGLGVQLARLRPHGMGNPEPLIRMGPLVAATQRSFGGTHLELSARAAGERSSSQPAERLVLFQAARFAVDWDAPFEILAAAEADAWNGGFRLRVLEARACDRRLPP